MSQDINNVSTGAEEDSDLSNALGTAETEFVTGEEKKSQSTQYMLLGGLLLLAPAVLWYMSNRGPASAAAATIDQPPAAAQTVHTFLDSGQDGIKAMRAMLTSTEKVVNEFLSYPSMTQVPLTELKTNPFRSSAVAGESGDAADKKKREEERAAVVKAVQTLQLQSIMSGKKSACMINNTLYTEGQQVNQFTVEKISNGVVIVRSGQYRFELKMQK
ncbi:MAG TPA: hypothetical protein VF669_06410 [Tepidisphaeraceae bacterium]|jgi:hypothetical protein